MLKSSAGGAENTKDLEEEEKMNTRLTEIKEELEHNKSLGALETDPDKRAKYQNKIESLKVEGDEIRKTKLPIVQTRLKAFNDKIKQIDDQTKNTIETKQRGFTQQLSQADNKIRDVKDLGKNRQRKYAEEIEKPRLANLYNPSQASLQAALSIRKELRKSKEQRLLDDLKDYSSREEKAEKKKDEGGDGGEKHK